jgi:hypothetical protein
VNEPVEHAVSNDKTEENDEKEGKGTRSTHLENKYELIGDSSTLSLSHLYPANCGSFFSFPPPKLKKPLPFEPPARAGRELGPLA